MKSKFFTFLRSGLCLGLALAGGVASGASSTNTDVLDQYLDLPLEDLLSLEVSSVSKRLEKLRSAAAAVYVITAEDIRRMGATSIPEALRLAPGVQVGRISSSQETVSVRGFGGRYANKLLVLIDGRSIYTPSFAGVYWDEHDIPLENIERIEVIRGPGATLWGANAVNGIINIITRKASDTSGGYASAGVGSYLERQFSARQSLSLAEGVDGYLFAKHAHRGSLPLQAGGDAHDAWVTDRAGFRADGSAADGAEWSLQGDFFRNRGHEIDATAPMLGAQGFQSDGWFLSGKWVEPLEGDSNLVFKAYLDHKDRDEPFVRQIHDTLDLQIEHHLAMGRQHQFVWGAGYRRVADDFSHSSNLLITPAEGDFDHFNAFVQDEITLMPERFRLIVGSKFEHNPYTGFEVQPNIRGVWTPNETHAVWASISRAVHTPSRVNEDADFTVVVAPPAPPVRVLGNSNLNAESMIAYEAGYRWNPDSRLGIDVAAFYNDYRDVIDGVRDPFNPLLTTFENGYKGQSWGGEVAADWQMSDQWRAKASYSFIRIDTNSEFLNDNTPEQHLALRLMYDIDAQWQLDLWGEYVDRVARATASAPTPVAIDAYTTLNLRLGWQPRPGVEISLAGKNLLEPRHMEARGEVFTPATAVERSVELQVRLDWD